MNIFKIVQGHKVQPHSAKSFDKKLSNELMKKHGLERKIGNNSNMECIYTLKLNKSGSKIATSNSII